MIVDNDYTMHSQKTDKVDSKLLLSLLLFCYGRELDSSKQNLLKISIYAFICFSYFVVLYRSFVNILKQARVISTKIDIRKYELIGDVFLINVLYYLLSIIVISIKYFSKGVVKKEQIGVHFLNQVSFDTFMLSKENV